MTLETNNLDLAVDLAEGQMDLFTGEVVEEIAEEELTSEAVVEQLVEAAFDGQATITAYKISTIINGAFNVLQINKQIPPQMMYNYARNGLINKVKGQKQYNKEEVTTFVQKYINKFI